MTEIAVPPAPVAATLATEEKKSRLGIILAVLFFLILAAGAAGFVIFGGLGDATPTPDDALIAGQATETPSPEPTASPTIEPEDTVDVGATAVAAIAAILTAEPTKTSLPTATVLASPTPTPDITATFIVSCEPEIILASSYTFDNKLSSTTPVDINFVMNWVLVNESVCPAEAGAEWTYLEGDELGQSGPVAVEDDLLEGDEATLTADLRSPSAPGRYESTWQLFDLDGNPLGLPQTFEIMAYQPQTPTPAQTSTPEATATSEIVEPFGRNLNIANCQYVDINWQCDLVVQPYGGRAPYTLTVSDQEPPKVYEGDGPFIHTILWGRCTAWVNNISVQDATGFAISRAEFYDPHNYFEGGCTPP
jgi:hypothetical protein